MKTLFLFFTCFCSFLFLYPQSYQLSNHIPVRDLEDRPLANPWAGGMAMPQFSTIDLNGDDYLDLVTFDREDASFTPYLNLGKDGESNFVYAPEYKKIFEDCDCFGWAKTIDTNCDGKEDVLCGTRTANVLHFIQVENVNGEKSFESTGDRLRSLYSSGFAPLFSGKLDYPAVIDVDYDGDLDFLTWANGFDFVELHRNKAQELYGRCDTLIFEMEKCWGHFREIGFENDFQLEDTVNCPLGDYDPNRVSTESRHGAGSSTLLLDLNADSTYDALIGDADFREISALFNGGTIQYAYMDSLEQTFPQYDIPIDLDLFPACFYIDIDNDQKRDMIVAPNHGVSSQVENTEGVRLYQNVGADNAPIFELQDTPFLQQTHIEHGDDAAAAFFDYDQDGLLDMLVGNHGYRVDFTDALIPAFSLYKNIGTQEQPEFQLIDDDYLGLRESGAFPLLKNMVPTFGDLDDDGDDDLLVGTIIGQIYYFENTASTGEIANFVVGSEKYMNIDVGNFAAPQLYDVDDDDDLDLIIGAQDGFIEFYENKGTKSAPNFELVTEEWGGIQIPDEFGSAFPRSYPKPLLVDYDEDGDVELLVGSITGYIRVYEGVDQALTDTLNFAGNLFDYQFGSFSAPTAAILDSTEKPMYIVGNRKGGLELFSYSDNLPTNISNRPDIGFNLTAFPNPASQQITIRWQMPAYARQVQISVFNQMGQEISRNYSNQGQIDIQVNHWASGIYFARISDGRQVGVVKFIVK